jgi:competence protein ComEC
MRKVLPWLLLLCLLLSSCSLLDPIATVPRNDYPTTQADSLSVHYVDVGQADCALLECGGQYMIIDGGNVDDSDLVVTYLQDQGVEQLHAVICTHAHEDHVGGLAAVLAVYPTEQILSPTRTYSSACFDDFLYYADQQDIAITIPDPGDSFYLGNAEVTVLGPVKSYADPNNTSIVVKVEFGDTSFLFTGDMEKDAETDMLDYGMDVSADVLKVGHHGSSTSTGYRFLRAVMPTYGLISVGEGNTYGHPHEAPLSRLEQAGVIQYRTDKLGTVLAVSDGRDITFTWESASGRPQDPTESAPTEFIDNKNSKTLHLPTCSSLPKAENRVVFDDYDEAIAQGYKPCGKCME